MVEPSTPDNEKERLADLRALKVLDTPPEERFDRVTRVTANVFSVPIAYIALIDSDRQWFKSKYGLQEDSTTRKVSFCGHAILGDTPMIVPDALEDERFFNNPMVIDAPKIRFYAGCPLKGPGGNNIGTLCIADHSPRSLSDLELETFTELAQIAEHELSLVDLISSQKQLIDTKSALLEARKQLSLELQNAADYVRTLLPMPLTVVSTSFDHRFLPSADLGGDHLGFIQTDSEHVVFYLLDVTGHGVASSLLAVSINNMIKQLIASKEYTNKPGELLTELNKPFQAGDHAGRFATVWLGVLNVKTRKLIYANAGHHPVIVIDNKNIIQLEEGGIPLGVLPDFRYQEIKVELPIEGKLYLFSDGLYEQKDLKGNEFGLKNLHQTIAGFSEKNIINKIIAEVQRATGTTNFSDDVSILQILL